MVGEVNKIIYNMLISGRGVHLPELGVLYIERQAARKLTDGRLLSPRNVVVYSLQEQAPSLVDEIVAIAKCSVEQAQDIYERWKAKTYAEGVLTIGGVGLLKNGVFSTDKAFLGAINPQGIKTIVVRKRRRSSSNAWLYAVSGVAIVVALGFLAFLMWGDMILGTPKSAEKVVAEAVVAEAPAVESAEQVAEVAEQPAEQPAMQSAAPQVVVSDSSYAYYVVMGIFSTPENAARAVEQTRSKIKDAGCVVLPFKGKHMVTIYGSDKREDCNAFARSYRDIYPDLWVYNKQ